MNKRQDELLSKLINDSCSQLSETERGIHMISTEGLLWNLFKGKYKFSLNDVKFVIEAKQKSIQSQ